jgi:DNA polymerase-3 subunit gamma/tau
MAYISLYRKWRPQTFAEAIGQEHIVQTLTNALETGRVAHAYLFSGPRGTGKTSFARLLAKGLNCVHGPTGTPCNECDNCIRITRGISVDVIEIDGASNRGIDEIRELRERVKYAPIEGRHKVYIIDEVHMLTNEAFNALLKVLEEPPEHVNFVFATTEAHKVPATILSRCQKFDFRRFSTAQLMYQLEKVSKSEGVEAEPQALTLIARAGPLLSCRQRNVTLSVRSAIDEYPAYPPSADLMSYPDHAFLCLPWLRTHQIRLSALHDHAALRQHALPDRCSA